MIERECRQTVVVSIRFVELERELSTMDLDYEEIGDLRRYRGTASAAGAAHSDAKMMSNDVRRRSRTQTAATAAMTVSDRQLSPSATVRHVDRSLYSQVIRRCSAHTCMLSVLPDQSQTQSAMWVYLYI